MEYLNIHRSDVEGEAMQDATPGAVRAWLFLNTYCVGQENGGRIAGARQWPDRKWLKLCSLSYEDIHGASELWHWDGDDLVMEFYPADQEAEFRAKREGGRLGGKRSGRARKEAAREAQVKGEVEAQLEASSEGEVERKEKERKEKEGKGRERAREGEPLIPTEQEVRTWAELAGVDPEFAAQKWASTNETHGWMKNGRLIDWRSRFKRFWEDDKALWLQWQKNRCAKSYPDGAKNGADEKPAGWKTGDQDWWWTEGLDLIEKAFHGALMGGQQESADRLREILQVRRDA
jgi:hypothetical protein